MPPTPHFRLKCSTIVYRKGFIEVTPNIHDGCVNLETWDINAETDIDNCAWVDDTTIDDSQVIANCEIEMTISEAQQLAEMILKAVKQVT